MGKKILKWMNHLVTGLLVILFITVAAVVITSKLSGGEPQFFGYQIKTVLSGSMEPGIKTGSVIVVKPGGDMTRFKEGDIITFMDDQRRLITHRVIEAYQSGDNYLYRTKGDNNEEADPDVVLSQNVVAEYTGITIPYLGYFSEFAKSKNGALVLIILPGVLLLLYSVVSIWRTISLMEKQYKKNSELEKSGNPEPPRAD